VTNVVDMFMLMLYMYKYLAHVLLICLNKNSSPNVFFRLYTILVFHNFHMFSLF